MKETLIIIGIILLLIFGGIGIKIAFFPVHKISKSIDMTYETTNKVLDADKAIHNYEYFKVQKERIDAMYRQEQTSINEKTEYLETMPTDKTTWDMFDKNELSRLRSNITGIRHRLDDALADYNAKSQMVNRSIFKDNLPVTLSRSFYTVSKLNNQ
jgi:hypothetical protein